MAVNTSSSLSAYKHIKAHIAFEKYLDLVNAK